MYECLRRHYLPTVLISIARQQNLITILLSILQCEHDRNWFVTFLRSSSKNSLEKQSIDSIREDLVDSCYSGESIKEDLIKLYSALRIYAGLKFNELETKALMNLIENSKEICLAVSFLLVYPALYENDLANFNRIVQWIKDNFIQSKQNLFLIAIYCSSNQLQQLNDFVSNIIGFKCALKLNSLNSLSKIFQQVFPDEMLINEYLKHLPITFNLNAKLIVSQNEAANSPLGIYFLNQLIKNSSILNKRELKLNEWLFDQILACSSPIHPIMVNLINNYLILLFNPNIQNEYRLLPIDKLKIFNFFKMNSNTYSEDNLTPKLLLFYYLLFYEEKRRELIYGKSQLKIDSLVSYSYSREIYDFIEINFLLLKAKHSNYFILYPGLLRLATNMFPLLSQVQHSLYFDNKFITSKWNNFELILKYLKRIKDNYVLDNVTRSLTNRVKHNWFKAYSIYGRRLSLKTACVLLDTPTLKFNDIYSDPLTLLRTQNNSIFKCGPLLEILLYIIKECLIASRSNFDYWLIDNHPAINKESRANFKLYREREDLRHSLAATQEVALIQTLLDIYLNLNSNELEKEEIKCLVCSFIHQSFIDNSTLAELVHFQTYDSSLISILVNGVPSMHICLDFIPKLFAHNDLNKQIFAFKLTASLCTKYPIIKTFNVAKLAISVVFTLLQTLVIDERRKLFNEIKDSLVTIYTKLPTLTQESMSLFFNAVKTQSIDVDSIPNLLLEY